MPKTKPEDSTRDELLKENDVPVLADDTVTLRLKQNAFWQGVFHPAGDTFDYSRADAENLLRTTDLFEPAGAQS